MMIAYLVPDLGDPAVKRRTNALLEARADLALAGFRRKDALRQDYAVSAVAELGRTFDHQLAQRAATTLKLALLGGGAARRLPAPDVILARNLEMLLLARVLKATRWPKARICYEVLDVHRMMLRKDAVGSGLRALERVLAAGAASVVISSRAFLDEYFAKVQRLERPYFIAENKVVAKDGVPDLRGPAPGPPWRLAWYGMLRCQKSLDILDRTSRALGGLLEVDIRGRPTLGFFRDFEAQVAANPHLRYGGPYAAEEIWRLYGGAHLVWGVDYSDEGMNSDWLLPNRLYEGGAADVPVIARADAETGRWLRRRGAGVVFEDVEGALAPFVSGLDEGAWRGLRAAARTIPRSDLLWSAADGAALLKAVSGEGA